MANIDESSIITKMNSVEMSITLYTIYQSISVFKYHIFLQKKIGKNALINNGNNIQYGSWCSTVVRY